MVYIRDDMWLELRKKALEFKNFWKKLQKVRQMNGEILKLLDTIGELQIEEIEELKRNKKITTKQV